MVDDITCMGHLTLSYYFESYYAEENNIIRLDF